MERLKTFSFKQRLFVLAYFIYVLFCFALNNDGYGFSFGFFIGSTLLFPLFLIITKWVYDGFKVTKYMVVTRAFLRLVVGLFGYLLLSSFIASAIGGVVTLFWYLLSFLDQKDYDYSFIFYKSSGVFLVLTFLGMIKDYEFKEKMRSAIRSQKKPEADLALDIEQKIS